MLQILTSYVSGQCPFNDWKKDYAAFENKWDTQCDLYLLLKEEIHESILQPMTSKRCDRHHFVFHFLCQGMLAYLRGSAVIIINSKSTSLDWSINFFRVPSLFSATHKIQWMISTKKKEKRFKAISKSAYFNSKIYSFVHNGTPGRWQERLGVRKKWLSWWTLPTLAFSFVYISNKRSPAFSTSSNFSNIW